MADIAVLTAVSGAGWEPQLVTTLESAPGGLYVARRCVDVADLLATASAGHGRVVLLSADLRRLDREVLSRLRSAGLAVVGVVPPGVDGAATRLHELGVAHVVGADVGPDELAGVVVTAVEAVGEPEVATRADHDTDLDDSGHADRGPGDGGVIAVWGPVGAPGRTTVAVNLAAELAQTGLSVLLIDADTYGSSVAQHLGLLDEAPGLAGVSRAANNGRVDADVLARHAREVVSGLRVLTGISRSGRWPELRPSSLEAVWAAVRHAADVTVVDAGFCLERDDEISFDIAAPRRNGATISALEHADHVLAVGAGDPIGLARLVRGLGDLREIVPGVPISVVINRVRSSVAGPEPEREIAGAMSRYAGVAPAAFIPDDPAALDAAVRGGLSLVEVAPGSPARQALIGLAGKLTGVPVQRPARVRWRRLVPAG
ncbi:MAG TPA: P-loop NTPase [Jiangellaceae bacterium]